MCEVNTDKHGPAGPATGGAAPGPIAEDDLPWPPWLENLSDEERVATITGAVAACAGHAGPHDGHQAPHHCTPVMGVHYLNKLLPASPGDGVSRWTVTRIGLIEALRKGWPDLPVAILARSADTTLEHLAADGESSTEAEMPAQALAALADALDRRADRTGDFGLTRDGSIRARVLREAAGMARARAQDGAESAYGAGPVSLGTESGSGDPDATRDGPAEYRKKGSATVQAWQVTGASGFAVAQWCGGVWDCCGDSGHPGGQRVRVPAPEGPLCAHLGWWVLLLPAGEFRPVRDSWFTGIYEAGPRALPGEPS